MCNPPQIYEGEVEPWLMSDYCTDTVPVLLRRATFCRAFAADAKDFRAYNSWVRRLWPPHAGLPCSLHHYRVRRATLHPRQECQDCFRDVQHCQGSMHVIGVLATVRIHHYAC